ncbi:hypothetical protein SO802_026378 [Lithocarpus litseifolius]|uniref:Uncharacterized protein n=1 Tax=Lithocarpus litseifolius TaxID=425828 RepID=A0AAW2C104_9ROSI
MKVWMYEYFGVSPQVLADAGDMYPRLLCWLPKYRLSVPPKRSLQVWRIVIDNLTTDDFPKKVTDVCSLLCTNPNPVLVIQRTPLNR